MCPRPPIPRLPPLAIVLVLLLSGSSPPAFAGEEKLAIQLRGQPGQAWVFEQAYELSISSTLSADGQEPQAVTQKMHQGRSGTIRLLQVKAGIPTAMKVSFDASCGATVEQTGQERHEVEFPLAGQTVALWRGADGSVENDFRGSLDEQTLNELRALLEPENRLYPPIPVARSDTWKISKDSLARHFQLKEADQGAGVSRLDAVKTADGRPVADVAMGISLIKFEQGFIKTEINLKGGARVDLSTGHTIAGVLEGPLVMSGSQRIARDGQKVTVKVSGEGKVSFRSASKWVTVAPIPGADAPPVAVVEPQKRVDEPQKRVEVPATKPVARPPVVEPPRPLLPRPLPPGVLAAGGVGARPPNARAVTPRNGNATTAEALPASAVATSSPPADEPFTGVYRDDNLRVDMRGVAGNTTGTIRLGAQRFPLKGKVEADTLTGTFEANGTSFRFAAAFDGPTLLFTTENTTYRLKREGKNPLDQ